MSSPTFSDALSYGVDAQAEILSAVADWKSYADAAAEAYSQAYADQGIVLGNVNKRLEEMRKEDAERMTLALTILTVGVAGPIASVLVKDKAAKVFEKLAENLQGKASKTALGAAGEMVKDSAGDLTKKGLEKVAEEVSKAYERPSVEDAFHSSGVPPDQYGDQLQEAIDLQTGVLQKLTVQREGELCLSQYSRSRFQAHASHNAPSCRLWSRFGGSWLTNCNFRPARSTSQGGRWGGLVP
jgi:hypothetical protein